MTSSTIFILRFRFCFIIIIGEKRMSESMENETSRVGHVAKRLTPEEIDRMKAQNSRLVSEFRANQLERDAKKHWDLFYKRNDTRFFKDRHWTTREFDELLGLGGNESDNVLLEVGCGVGNFVYPLMEDGLKFRKIFACDLSTKAIELFKVHLSEPSLEIIISNYNWNVIAHQYANTIVHLVFYIVESHIIPSGNNEGLSGRYYIRELFF